MKTLTTALLALVITSGCGKKPPPPPPETVAPPPEAEAPRPTEPTPFTLTYTYKAKADGTALTFMLSSDGRVDATTEMPRAHYVGKVDAGLVEDIARFVADPELRALPEKNEAGPAPVVELELLDAKGNLWRRHFAGMPPKVTSPLFDRLERLQRAAQREDRPPAVMKLDVTRTPAGGGPVEVISINANSLVLVTADGKPKALGRVGGGALDTLRVTTSVLPQLRPTVAAGPGTRLTLAIELADKTKLEARFDGGVPLVAEPVMQVIAELEAETKPVATFDEITYQVPRPGKNKKQVQTLTVLPSGRLLLVAEGETLGTGEAAIEELWGLQSVLVGFEAIKPGAPVGRGNEILRVKGPTGEREVRASANDAPADAKKVLQYMNRFLVQIAPPPPEEE